MKNVPVCYFCGKDKAQVKRLVVHSGYFKNPGDPERAICWECITLYMEILASENASFRDELVEILQAVEPKDTD